MKTYGISTALLETVDIWKKNFLGAKLIGTNTEVIIEVHSNLESVATRMTLT